LKKDFAVEYVDPTNDTAIARALERVLGSAALRKRLRAAGLKRAKGYSWERTAEIAAKALRGL